LTLNANGSFTYTPVANYNGADSFTYRASDGALTSNVAMVSVTVAARPLPPSTVVGRLIFYNRSVYDGSSPGVDGTANDNAIAPDKVPYLPLGGVATFDNVTSFVKGINGIMIDLAGAGSHNQITADDFSFKVGDDNSPGSWTAAPVPSSVIVRAGAGTGGSDRIEVTWASGDIKNTWLQVQVNATASTGLTSIDVFFWGNRVGDTGTGATAGTFVTSAADWTEATANAGLAGLASPYDFNRDGVVSAVDWLIVSNNRGALTRIAIGQDSLDNRVSSQSAATDSSGNALASGFAMSSSTATEVVASNSVAQVDRRSNRTLTISEASVDLHRPREGSFRSAKSGLDDVISFGTIFDLDEELLDLLCKPRLA
jgi:hypothetical protein